MPITETIDSNDGELYGAKVGLLGDELARAGIARGVVANGDGVGPEHARDAFLALAARRGGGADDQRRQGAAREGRPRAVAARRRGTVRCPARPRPRGARVQRRVDPRLGGAWWRAPTSYAPTSRRASHRTSRRSGSAPTRSEATDGIVGRLLEHTDRSDMVMVLGPNPPSSRDALNVASVRAPGFAPGLLRSTTTQRDGFVNLTDVAPTVLTYFGLERPDDMEGRRMETGDAGGSLAARTEFLVNVNEDGLFRDSLIGASMGVVVGLACGLTVLTAVADRWRRRWLPGLLVFVALWLLGYPRRHVPRRSRALRSPRRARRVLGVRDRRGHADRGWRACSSPDGGRSTRSWSASAPSSCCTSSTSSPARTSSGTRCSGTRRPSASASSARGT